MWGVIGNMNPTRKCTQSLKSKLYIEKHKGKLISFNGKKSI